MARYRGDFFVYTCVFVCKRLTREGHLVLGKSIRRPRERQPASLIRQESQSFVHVLVPHFPALRGTVLYPPRNYSPSGGGGCLYIYPDLSTLIGPLTHKPATPSQATTHDDRCGSRQAKRQ